MKITTNNVPRDVLFRWELTADELSEFDYLGPDEGSFVRYKGQVYDLGEFLLWDNPASPTRQDWDGFRSDSFFSGLAIRFVEETDRVVVALITC